MHLKSRINTIKECKYSTLLMVDNINGFYWLNIKLKLICDLFLKLHLSSMIIQEIEEKLKSFGK